MYMQYGQRLSSYMKVPIVMLVIGLGILLVLAVLAFKFKFFKEIRIYLVLGILALMVGYFMGVYPYQQDISTEAYQKYIGEFYVEEYYFSTNSGVHMLIKFPDSEKSIRYRAPGDIEGIENNTTYYGVLVYGKYSKGIVEIRAEPKETP